MAPSSKRGVDLGGEEFLAVDRRQRSILDPVTAGFDADQLDGQAGVQAFEFARHCRALCTCQRGAARAELHEARGHGSNGVEGRQIFPAVRM